MDNYFDGTDAVIKWSDPQNRTLNILHADAEFMEILFGQPVIPLCLRQISARGEN